MPITAQLGIVFHAAVSVGRDVGAERDRALAGDDQPPVGLGEVLGEGLVHGRRLEERLDVALGRAGVAGEVEHGGRVGDVERGARPAEDLEDALADLGDERVDVDERLDVAATGAGVGDHHAAVGVADEHDRPGRALREERRDVGGVAGHPVQQVGRGQDGEALALELGRDGVPARAVGPGSVDEDDRGLWHRRSIAPSRRAVPAAARAA